MIKDKAKQKLIEEIQKSGNVLWPCRKIGIHRSTYYRWKKEDAEFKELADEAEMMGREDMCDVAKMSLMQNVKDKNQRAIEYLLNHLSPEFKQRQASEVIIVHKKELSKPVLEKTFEDIIDQEEETQEKINKIKSFYMDLDGIPPKSDGSKIEDDELIKYEGYIEDWYTRHHKLLKYSDDNILIFKRMDGGKDKTMEEMIAEDAKNSLKEQQSKSPSGPDDSKTT